MSACKAGCGWDAPSGTLCTACGVQWDASSESTMRVNGIYDENGDEERTFRRHAAALADFCNRVRAERQNGVPQ